MLRVDWIIKRSEMKLMLKTLLKKINTWKSALWRKHNSEPAKVIIQRRAYENYTDYLRHQKEKTLDPQRIQKWLGEEWDIKLEGFKRIFKRNWEYLQDKKNALCLGARTGQEVAALQSLGLNAIGIDLVPFAPYTIAGDVHDLAFKDGEFGFVFSNIFDHVLYPDKFCSEIERVLRPGGVAILHLQVGIELDEYAETFVNDPDAVIKLFENVAVVESRPIQNGF
ncbi:class I SAM-dependent methyltransferase, partial [Candidatus Parcubacteria bacterium]